MKKSESIKELSAAMNKFQKEIKPVGFDATNPFFKSKYATLTAIFEAIREPLAKNGLAILQGSSQEGNIGEVTTLLTHISGEWVESVIKMNPETLTPQKIGSAITYARRYGLSSLLGISSEEDDDGNGAQKAATDKIIDTAKKVFDAKSLPSDPNLKKPEETKKTQTDEEFMNSLNEDDANVPPTPQELRERIAKMLMECAGQDQKKAQDLLEVITVWKTKDTEGKEKIVKGKRLTSEISDKAIHTVYGKVKDFHAKHKASQETK